VGLHYKKQQSTSNKLHDTGVPFPGTVILREKGLQNPEMRRHTHTHTHTDTDTDTDTQTHRHADTQTHTQTEVVLLLY
jgi:hypothetical protein